jgi:serine/threonine protein kinase
MKGIPERYQPEKQVQGGMGSVFFCSDSILERKVAIKFIQQTEQKDRLIDELNALMKVRSKHVVQPYDIIEVKGLGIGIVQEFIEGPDLLDSFKPSTTASRYYKKLWQIASGIADIHNIEIIHRDIKPNNMKTDGEGVIKIFDFGLAKVNKPEASTKGFLGTHGFAAPELYNSDPKFTNAVDVYAFGATALFLASGDLPKELTRSMGKEVKNNYFESIQPEIALDIASILHKCLSHTPANRPKISEVRDILAKHLLHDQHQALVVYQNKATYLNSKNRSIHLSLENIGNIEIKYNGLNFTATQANKEVYLNNKLVTPGVELPGSCVVALGSNIRHSSERAFITFDLSNPEITI